MARLEIKIGHKPIGMGQRVYCVAEIGINHNGDINLAKDLIKAAAFAGCDAVKLQKRSLEVVYTPEQLAMKRKSPFGDTNRSLKEALELPIEIWTELKIMAEHLGLDLFASCWDTDSVELLSHLAPVAYKVPSPCLTNDALLSKVAAQGVPILMSLGMSTVEEIDHAIGLLHGSQLVIMHCISAYPTELRDVNLSAITTLKARYPNILVGYSGHEAGLITTYGAVALGACVVERHITLSRQLWGSDQAISLVPREMRKLVKGVQKIAQALGNGKLGIRDCEVMALQKLRYRV